MHRRFGIAALLAAVLCSMATFPLFAANGLLPFSIYLPLALRADSTVAPTTPTATSATVPTATSTIVPTSTPTAIPTSTPTATATATPVPTTLLPNGDFEQGATVWIPSDQAQIAIVLANEVPARSGQRLARLVASQDGEDGTALDQYVTIPIDKPYLSYWFQVRSTEPTCSNDVGGVGVTVGSSMPVGVDRVSLCVSTQTTRWYNHVIDFTAYSGQDILLEFLAGTFDTNTPNSYFYIEDVGFQATP